jgi:hypothetical protein
MQPDNLAYSQAFAPRTLGFDVDHAGSLKLLGQILSLFFADTPPAKNG